MPLKKVTLFHSEAKPSAVQVEVDVAKTFTLEEMKARHNTHLHRKLSELTPSTEPHTFTEDMLKVFAAWNPKVGWDGFYRLPEEVRWEELTAAESAARAAVAASGVPVGTLEEQIKAAEENLAMLKKSADEKAAAEKAEKEAVKKTEAKK